MSASQRQIRDAYDPFALIYNRGMAEDFCRRAWRIIEQLLLSRIPKHAHVLDLCCGSGQLARELSERGYRVVGLDGSPQMIALARKNAPSAKFVLADVRRFAFVSMFDAILSSFNSLAHASTLDELIAILRNARFALRPSGTMLFDLSMEEAYLSKWQGSFGEVHDDVAWFVRPSYDRKMSVANNEVTVFRCHGPAWERSDFTIVQNCFSQTAIQTALTLAGFTSVACFDAEQDLQMAGEHGRKFFVCG